MTRRKTAFPRGGGSRVSSAIPSTMPLVLATPLLLLLLSASTTMISIVHAQDSVPAGGTDLGGGIVTTTNVEHFAKISLDVAEMTTLTQSNSFNDAFNIYLAGKNSIKYDRNGNALPDKRTLSSMSTSAADGRYDGEIPFVYQMYGLAGGDGHTYETYESFAAYADTFVQDALKEQKGTLGPDAAIALNVWMYAAHVLTVAVEDCALESSGVNLDIIGRDEDLGGSENALEMFIAFWIGYQQAAGSDDGSSPYAMAERAATLFGTSDASNGEAMVNSNIKQLFNEAQQILSFPNACRPESDSASQLWGILHRTVSQMQVPLVQLLIDAMVREEQDRISLYAKAVVPQMSSCAASAYRRLKENLLDRTYDPTKFVDILADLQGNYDCLGFGCEDVGAYQTDKVAQCAELPVNYPMAEYSPTSHVHLHSKIDLDVNAIKALLSFDSEKSWAAAKDVYMYGKNSEVYRAPGSSDAYTVRSLQSLATSALRKKSPWYTLFEDYFQDPNYADTIVMDVFEGRGKWGNSAREQKAEMLTKTIQYQVLYMYLLAEAGDADADCRSGDKNDNVGGAHSWDEVAAYYIGSLEGVARGGSTDFADGQLQWNLANKRSTQFNTQVPEGYALVNSEIEDDLYAGKGELDAYACDSLAKTIKRIERNSIVPLIQSVIRYALKMEDLTYSSSSKDIAEGEAFALAVLPIVKSVDKPGAIVLENNMIIQDGVQPVAEGAQRVADAFYKTMVEFELECELVGQADGVSACDMFRKMSNPAGPFASVSLISSVVVVGVSILLAAFA